MEPEIFHEGWIVKSPPQKRSPHGYPLIRKAKLRPTQPEFEPWTLHSFIGSLKSYYITSASADFSLSN